MNIIWKGSGLKEVGYDTRSKKVIIKVDPYFFRPNDVQSLLGNSSKLFKIMKQKPKTSFNQLVKIMVKNEIKLIKQIDFTKI